MKGHKIIIICVLMALIVSFVVGIFIINNNKVSKEIQQKLPTLNSCYELIFDCYENGFNKDTAEENKELLKKALENGVSVELYESSSFYNSEITFCPDGYLDYNNSKIEANHSYDLLVSMYLTCIFVTDTQNFTKELIWLKECSYEMNAIPEFIFLISEKYQPTQDEIETIAKSLKTFANSLESYEDKYYTLGFVISMYSYYNNRHPNDNLNVEILQDITQERHEIFNLMDEKYRNNEVAWVGYGKYVELN